MTAAPAAGEENDVPMLRVGANGRYLARVRDNAPFLWLGDTAWLLFQKTTRRDADLYLRTRARQGFTVIQAAIVMGEERVGGTLGPNREGRRAFLDGDPSRPDVNPDGPDYWDFVDYVVERAATHGLVLGLLPLFVGYAGEGYKYLKPENAGEYGRFLGRRYRNREHLVWILGGDNTPDTEAKRTVWERMARGITVGVAGAEDYRRTLMSYHINGGASSSQWFHQAPWLDFNMTQVWGSEKDIYAAVTRDYQRTPVKPAGLGEGSYENGPQYPTRPIDAVKIRRQAYWSYLPGGYHTYGNTDVWNFGSVANEAHEDWKKALESPGAACLSVLARLLPTLEWWKWVPDPAVLASGGGTGAELSAAARSESGDRLIVYLAAPATVALRLDRLSAGDRAGAAWVDPQTGSRTPVGTYARTDIPRLTTPGGWPDALLVVEKDAKK